jgi:hypothetical protein
MYLTNMEGILIPRTLLPFFAFFNHLVAEKAGIFKLKKLVTGCRNACYVFFLEPRNAIRSTMYIPLVKREDDRISK